MHFHPACLPRPADQSLEAALISLWGQLNQLTQQHMLQATAGTSDPALKAVMQHTAPLVSMHVPGYTYYRCSIWDLLKTFQPRLPGCGNAGQDWGAEECLGVLRVSKFELEAGISLHGAIGVEGNAGQSRGALRNTWVRCRCSTTR